MRWYHYALIVLALAGGGYAVGRFAAPDKIKTEIRESVHTVQVEDTKAREQVRTLTEQLAQAKRDTKIVRVRVERPDGTKTSTETIEHHEQTQTQTEQKQERTADVEKHAATETTQTRVAVSETSRERPRWHVSGLMGLDVAALLKGQALPVYGGHVQWRIAGPFTVGAWGVGSSASGAGGVSIGVEF